MSKHSIIHNTGLLLMIATAYLFNSVGASAAPTATACTATPEMELRLQQHPDAFAYTQIGSWFGERRQFVCASDAFASALKLDAHSANLNYLYGLNFYTAGHAAEAIGPLQQAIGIDPTLLQPHLLLAASLASQGRSAEAEAQWKAALRIDPSSATALHGLCKALIARGDSASVTTHLVGDDLDENLTIDKAQAFLNQNMIGSAMKVLQEGVKKYPNSDGLAKLAANVYVRTNRYDEAVRPAEIAAQAHPHDLEAQTTYLGVLVLTDNRTAARPLANRLLGVAPHDAGVLYLTGVLDLFDGDYSKARAHLEQAIAHNPNLYEARFNLGIALVQLEDYKGAKIQLQKALEEGAKAPEVHFELGMALRNLGEVDEAKLQFKLFQEQSQAAKKQGIGIHNSVVSAQIAASH